MTTYVPGSTGDPAPDLAYDLAHEIPDQRSCNRRATGVAPTTVHVRTQTAGYDGDYGYDLAHDVPGR